MKPAYRALCCAALLACGLPPAQAAMRCGSALVDEGDSIDKVLSTCGPPDHREVSPAQPRNLYRQGNAVNMEFWTYGPDNGMYRYLKFIEGKLVEIRSDRG